MSDFMIADVTALLGVRPTTAKLWIARGWITPSRRAEGTGTSHRFSFGDVVKMAALQLISTKYSIEPALLGEAWGQFVKQWGTFVDPRTRERVAMIYFCSPDPRETNINRLTGTVTSAARVAADQRRNYSGLAVDMSKLTEILERKTGLTLAVEEAREASRRRAAGGQQPGLYA